MKFCDECGAKLENNSTFCDECGAVQEKLSTEDSSNQEKKVYCDECGCEYEDDNLYCDNCGNKREISIKENESANKHKQKKKSKKPIIIVIIIILVIALASGAYFLWFHNKNNLSDTINNNQTTQPITEKPTEKITEVKTEKPTEEKTEKPTEKPTEKKTEKPTEIPTEKDGYTLSDVAGVWGLDYEKNLSLGVDLEFLFGTLLKLSPGVIEIDTDGNFSYSVAGDGGEGTCHILDETIYFSLTNGNVGEVDIVGSSSTVDYLILKIGFPVLYFSKSTSSKEDISYDDFYGRWQIDSYKTMYSSNHMPTLETIFNEEEVKYDDKYITLNEDKTYTLLLNKSKGKEKGTYKLDGDTITLTASNGIKNHLSVVYFDAVLMLELQYDTYPVIFYNTN